MTDQPPSYPPPGGYGYPPPAPGGSGGYPPGTGYPQPVGTNGFAIAALACALVGLVCFGTGSFLGIVFGFIALNQIKRTGQNGRGMAITGIVIGAVITVGWVILILVAGILGAFDSKNQTRYDRYDYSAPASVVSTAISNERPGLIYCS